jgi:hypothetical protein
MILERDMKDVVLVVDLIAGMMEDVLVAGRWSWWRCGKWTW